MTAWCTPHICLVSLPASRKLAMEHAQLAEEAGIGTLWVGDHLGAGYLDGWSLVAAWAMLTARVRIGVLVSSMIYRHPVLLARQAAAVDVLSRGRVEVALGAGELRSDHILAGVPYWPPAERSTRFREYVALVDGLLRGRTCDQHGQYYRWAGTEQLSPPPAQRPRPPLTVAAYGPVTTRVAAHYADTWNTFCGGMHLPDRELIAVAALRLKMADRACRQVGRDPETLRRSILVAPQHRPWRSVSRFDALVNAYAGLGFDEVICYAPEPEEIRVCVKALAKALPRGAP